MFGQKFQIKNIHVLQYLIFKNSQYLAPAHYGKK